MGKCVFLLAFKPHFISSAYPFSSAFTEFIEKYKSKSRLRNLLYILAVLGPRDNLLYMYISVVSKI